MPKSKHILPLFLYTFLPNPATVLAVLSQQKNEKNEDEFFDNHLNSYKTEETCLVQIDSKTFVDEHEEDDFDLDDFETNPNSKSKPKTSFIQYDRRRYYRESGDWNDESYSNNDDDPNLMIPAMGSF